MSLLGVDVGDVWRGGVCLRCLGNQFFPGVSILDFGGPPGGVVSLLAVCCFLVGETWSCDACGVWRADTCCGGLFCFAAWATASLRSPFTRFFEICMEAGSGMLCPRIGYDRSTCPFSSFGVERVVFVVVVAA